MRDEYYNVNSDQVLTRIQLACACEGTLLDGLLTTTNKADYYGPIWIGATSSVALLLSASIGEYLQTGHVHPDYHGLLRSLLTIYGYMTGEAIGVWLVINYAFGVTNFEATPALLTTLIGYSLAVLPPACIIAAIPWTIWQLIVMGSAGVLSCLFIYRNAMPVLSRYEAGVREEQWTALMAVWLICHASLFMLLKMRHLY